MIVRSSEREKCMRVKQEELKGSFLKGILDCCDVLTQGGVEHSHYMMIKRRGRFKQHVPIDNVPEIPRS